MSSNALTFFGGKFMNNHPSPCLALVDSPGGGGEDVDVEVLLAPA